MTERDDIAEAIEHYRATGYGVLRGVFTADEIAELAAAFDHHWARGMALGASFRHGNLLYRIGEDARLGRTLRMVQWPSYQDALLARVRTDARFFALLQPLLGGEIKQIINQFHWKRPGSVGEFAFHQDVRFPRPREAYRHLAESYVQTGIAIDGHDAESGAVKIYPASHRIAEVDPPNAPTLIHPPITDYNLPPPGLHP